MWILVVAFISTSSDAKGHPLDLKSPSTSEPDKEGPSSVQGRISPAMESLQHHPSDFSSQP